MRAACSVRMGRRRLPSQAKPTEMGGECQRGHAPGDERYDDGPAGARSAAQVLKLYDSVLTKATTELGRL